MIDPVDTIHAHVHLSLRLARILIDERPILPARISSVFQSLSQVEFLSCATIHSHLTHEQRLVNDACGIVIYLLLLDVIIVVFVVIDVILHVEWVRSCMRPICSILSKVLFSCSVHLPEFLSL